MRAPAPSPAAGSRDPAPVLASCPEPPTSPAGCTAGRTAAGSMVNVAVAGAEATPSAAWLAERVCGPTTAEAVTSPDNCTVNPGVPVPSMLSTALSSAPSEGWVITGPARSETLTEREAAPDRLKPFTVSAENWNRPVVDGAGKDQLP